MRFESSLCGMTPIVLLAALLFPASSSAGLYAMPADPEGATVIDREFVWTSTGDMNAVLAILYSRDGTEYVDITSVEIGDDGVEWDLLHTWPVSIEGRPVNLPLNTVMTTSERSGDLYFSFIDGFEMYEGQVSVYLCFDPETHEIEAGWVD